MPITIRDKDLEKDVVDFALAFKVFKDSDCGTFYLQRGEPSSYCTYPNDIKYKSIFAWNENNHLTIWFYADPDCTCKVRVDLENKRFHRLKRFFGFRSRKYPEISIWMNGYEIITDNKSIRSVLKCKEKYMLGAVKAVMEEQRKKQKEAEDDFKELRINCFINPDAEK